MLFIVTIFIIKYNCYTVLHYITCHKYQLLNVLGNVYTYSKCVYWYCKILPIYTLILQTQGREKLHNPSYQHPTQSHSSSLHHMTMDWPTTLHLVTTNQSSGLKPSTTTYTCTQSVMKHLEREVTTPIVLPHSDTINFITNTTREVLIICYIHMHKWRYNSFFSEFGHCCCIVYLLFTNANLDFLMMLVSAKLLLLNFYSAATRDDFVMEMVKIKYVNISLLN